MAEKRRGKRKSPCNDFFSEIIDLDLSPENSNSDMVERESKILKMDDENTKEQTMDSNLSKTPVISIDSPKGDSISDFVDLAKSPSSNSINNGSLMECIDISEGTDAEIDLTQVSENNEIDITDLCTATTQNDNKNINLTVTTEVVHEETKKKEPESDNTILSTKVAVMNKIDLENSTSDNKLHESKDSDNPFIKVQFQCKEMADLYKSKFLRFLESFAEFEIQTTSDDLTLQVERDPTLNLSEWVIVSQCDTLDFNKEVLSEPAEIEQLQPKKKKKKSKAKKELFVVDTTPNEDACRQTNLKYSSKFVIESGDKAIKVDNMRVSSQACFNCGKPHTLKDCPDPKNFDKIRAARQKFSTQQQQKNARYHLEEDQKFHHIKPGQISDKLKKALGIHKNEIPAYIYQMRLIGYPPGWLEEAKFVHSNLNMFDIDGKNVKDSLKKKKGLNSEKIIDYPGFNVPLEKGYRDEYKKYKVPPYSDRFSKDIMLDVFEQQFSKEQDDLETCDMEVENQVAQPEDPEDNNEINDSKYNVQLPAHLKKGPRDSPSLKELEDQKKELLAELQDSSNSNPKSEVFEAENKSVTKPLTIKVLKNSKSSENSTLSPELDNNMRNVKETSFGTPILKSGSPYARLPNPENFMKDVSPVINFENLPNSTGKYEQMNGVIQKVRDKLKNIQKCNT